MMSLRLKIMIAVLALGLSAFAMFGDVVFRAMGLPSGSGRIVVAAVLLVIGVIWFVASRKWAQRITNNASSHRRE